MIVELCAALRQTCVAPASLAVALHQNRTDVALFVQPFAGGSSGIGAKSQPDCLPNGAFSIAAGAVAMSVRGRKPACNRFVPRRFVSRNARDPPPA